MTDLDRRNFVAALTWADVARRLEAGAAAILPVGAGAKQHGLHLPMGTDQVQAEISAARLAGEMEALIWPTLLYGSYPAFVAYAGSISLTNMTFEALVRGTAEGMLKHGARRVFILNTGLSTRLPIDAAIAQLSAPERVRHLKIYEGPRVTAAVASLEEQSYGSHADEIETSIMLALAPGLVAMERAEASLPLRGALPLSPDDPSSPNYSPSGSYGDPTKASAEKGRILAAAIMQDLVAAVQLG